MARRHIAVAVLLVVTALSGCVALPSDGDDGPSLDITQTDGLSTTFESLSPTYREGEDIALRLTLKNTGEATARDMVAELFGPLFLNTDTCGDLRRGAGSRLQGVDRAAQQEGGTTAVEWTCTNPVDLPAGDTRDVEAGAVVVYRYSSTARTSFRVVPRATFTGTSSPVTTDTSAGPLSADVGLSSPVTITPPDRDDRSEQGTFNVSRVIADPAANTLTVVFNHNIDGGDFDLFADLQAFEITRPSGISLDTGNIDVEDDRAIFQVTGDMENADITLWANEPWIDIENTANEQTFTQATCDISVGSEEAESTDCSQQSWQPVSYYWQDMKIEQEGGGEATASLRMSQDLGDFRLPDEGGYTDVIEVVNASSNDPTPHVNFTGSISTVQGSPNIINLGLETADRDLSGEEIEITWLSRSGFGFVSAETDRVMDVGSCSAVVGAGYRSQERGGERYCASATEAFEQERAPGIAVPVTVRNVGDGMVGNIAEEPLSVEMTARIPNAPSGVAVHSCLGRTTFPVSFDLFDGQRDITCSVTLPEEAYDTQLDLELRMDYTYVETARTTFTLEGTP